MTFVAPLPKSVLSHIASNTHPGLLLDKYAESWSDAMAPEKLSAQVQKPTVIEVARLSQSPPADMAFEGLLAQRAFTMKAVNAIVVKATTAGPLTLHLSRASALENAGICLHRIYGFTYLPGTGIKGMVRAYAETVWLPVQEQRDIAWRQIEDVFGWAPNPDRNEFLKQNPTATRYREHSPLANSDSKAIEQRESIGRVVFHDAWPLAWPRLQTDILTSHHQKYYSATGEAVDPPGDWEEPIPVYFLCVAPGTPYEFGVSPRRSEDASLAELAGEWLSGALEYSGTGAKTNAGYGSFKIDSLSPSVRAAVDATWTNATTKPDALRSERSFTLSLATPAFLSGADATDPSGCDLRVSTLRGQLRWWWRTLHSAHLSPADMRRLESAIWGNTNRSGAVRVTLTRAMNAPKLKAIPFDRQGIVEANKLPKPSNIKTTQGLTYATYGMDEVKDQVRSRRLYLEPNSTWRVTFTVRSGEFVYQEKGKGVDEKSKPLSVDQIAEQAFAAFELLCRLGGVGSKSRKGFGNFKMPDELDLNSMEDRKAELMKHSHGLREFLSLRSGEAESPALDHLLAIEPVKTPWTNYWLALDRVGDAAQEFSQSKKHQLEKKALGLPRNVRAPYIGSFRPHEAIRDRHASPIHYHLSPGVDGKYVARIVAFPADRLPSFEKSREFLVSALEQIRNNLIRRAEQYATGGPSIALASKSKTAQVTSAPSGPKPPSPGDRVACKLSSEKTAKKGWKASYGNLTGPIQNSSDVPTDKQPGDEVTLIVRISNATEIAFRWPTPADERQQKK